MARRRPFAVALAVAVALAGAWLLAGAGAAPAAAATTHVVQMTEQGEGHYVFGPQTLTVAVGDTVTWRNTSDVPHTSTANDGAWDSGNVAPGQSFSFTFTRAGTYAYYCQYHRAMGMVGTIVVQAAAAAPATAAPATAAPAPAATAAPTAAPAPAAPGLPNTGGGGATPRGAAGALLAGLGLSALLGLGLARAQRRRRA
ncbi:MAG TPA: plastocyanin/azurin family copper-binding protein [Thermomicrobiales bacterium]|nr:plastocyanin/azurin family copper-binding protein [Thermomicrobiales bacterium]